jgi:hypothetical protein
MEEKSTRKVMGKIINQTRMAIGSETSSTVSLAMNEATEGMKAPIKEPVTFNKKSKAIHLS